MRSTLIRQLPRSLWIASLTAAVLALINIFEFRSSADKAWLLGLSLQRFALALIPFSWILISLLIAGLAWQFPNTYQRVRTFAHALPASAAGITGSICFWIALFVTAYVSYDRLMLAPNVVALTVKLGNWFPTVSGYMDRLWPVLFFLAGAMACWSLYVIGYLRQPFYRMPGLFIGSAVGVFSVLSTIFQWVVFRFQLQVFQQIPGWYWVFIQKKHIGRNAALLGLFLLVILLILEIVRRSRRSHWLSLVLIGAVFVGLQVSIGWMDGRGIASLTDRFFLSYHRIYTEEACNATIPAQEAVVHYEDLYPDMFLQTKPPGVLWLSFQIKQAANLPVLSPVLDRVYESIQLSKPLPRMTAPACQRSMALVTLLFPILATAALAAIYAFCKWALGHPEYGQLAGYSAILFILAPNILMLSLSLDQAFYPALFLGLACGIVCSIKKRSFLACFLMGLALYVAIFLSFSMLPLAGLPVIFLACVLWQERAPATFWATIKNTLLPLGLGILSSAFAFKLLFNYDVVTRYQRMMATRIEGDFYTRLGVQSMGEATWGQKILQTWEAAKLNNVELAVAIGIPVFSLFVMVGVFCVIRVLRRKSDTGAQINASLFLTYVGLNAIRVVLGEAARLWMFWVPVMAILAVQALLPITRRSRWLMITLVTVQVITVFLTYQYQDYLMPQLLP